MGIVSFGRSATVSTFVTSLALIVLSFTLSEQCIQPVFDRTNSSGTKMENCFQNLSTVIFVEGSIHGQDNVVSGPHGLSPTHLEAGHHGNTMDWPNKRFKILITVLGWPVALFPQTVCSCVCPTLCVGSVLVRPVP